MSLDLGRSLIGQLRLGHTKDVRKVTGKTDMPHRLRQVSLLPLWKIVNPFHPVEGISYSGEQQLNWLIKVNLAVVGDMFDNCGGLVRIAAAGFCFSGLPLAWRERHVRENFWMHD
ncbi:hypothetical protein M514_01014 [Trichuris suis]|uniref:Uncharacterized protein n=1 Tax=Trichuris suis TaxID=68888 RepID=A0A085NM20_9BILA|nr:hypothetical protein M513_01014 [Trichuris suis]KFD70516.1 hypothetical protein M514_01014 [Trichuris suis]